MLHAATFQARLRSPCIKTYSELQSPIPSMRTGIRL